MDPILELSNIVSLSLRGVLCHNFQSHQGLDSYLLPPSLPDTVFPNTMLVRDDVLRYKLNCVHYYDNISVSSSLVRLEQEPPRREMYQLQFGYLGQWGSQHSSGPSYCCPTYLRSSEIATGIEEKDWTLHNVWTWRIVSKYFLARYEISRIRA